MGIFRTKNKELTLKYLDIIRTTIAQDTTGMVDCDMVLNTETKIVGATDWVRRELTGRHHVSIELYYDIVRIISE